VSHTLVTIICPVSQPNVERARDLIEGLGNPAVERMHAAFEAVADGSDDLAIHFASLTVFPATAGGGHLLFEFSADGPRDPLIAALATHLDPLVREAFALAVDRGSAPLAEYWTSHIVEVGQGFFDGAGVVFAGTPGLSVRRIRQELALRRHLKTLVEENAEPFTSALAVLERVRRELETTPAFSWALEADDVAALQSERTGVGPYLRIGLNVYKAYLWPLFVPALLAFGLALAADLSGAGITRAVMASWDALMVTLAATLVALGTAYVVFRRKETRDEPEHRAPDPTKIAAIVARENFYAHNHLAALSVIKPGLLRPAVLKAVFATIMQLAANLFRPGWLGTLGTIHFARWVRVPGTRDLIFLSNYSGSFESYLEDFITIAHAGLTGVWSNTEGFPRAANLVQQGASDGDFFKRWARRQQVPTGCWYSAYPQLTTTNIRTNAAIRQGLGTILTEEEARRWLLLLGAAPRPASALEVNEIQSLVFGGLGFLKHAMCIGFAFGDRGAREWLALVGDQVSFGDGRKLGDCAITLGLAHSAFRKLDLPEDALATFPSAFLQGMAAPSRSRILGDDGRNAPPVWQWGAGANALDGVLLLYGVTPDALATAHRAVVEQLRAHGHRAVMEIPFVDLPDPTATTQEIRRAKLEPFGFVDGISQPAIRGTYKALRGADPIHLVEAGEFILGYPDNRGNLPAGPTLDAIHDPDNVLPIATAPQNGFARPVVNDDRDLGRNGTFLAIRQLEQDVDEFWQFCAQAAGRLHTQFPDWGGVRPEFVGAKLIGRWPDGSSVVRFPYQPGSEIDRDQPLIRPGQGPADQVDALLPPPALPPQPPAQPQAVATTRSHRTVSVKFTREDEREIAVQPDNDFLFGAEDPQGLRCPFGAHIRRANPRESFAPGSQEQLAITNRHRILRVGRRYRQADGDRPGLFFMCLNADLERQFEFVQQTWLQAPSFHGLMDERDPIIGSRHPDAQTPDDGFSLPTREAPVRFKGMPEFVRMLGGGYFFVPGRSLLQYLASMAGSREIKRAGETAREHRR
jgi:deferrochelatase/peroxidase EfeB